jgi:arylsulfatase A-like enzyme
MTRLLILLSLFLCCPRVHADDERPNIIFLFADDLAAPAVGYGGNDEVITPNIDSLARDGIRFLNHYNTTPICMASRCTVMTGLYEYRHGCNFEHGDLERRFIENSYPVLIRNAGYFTGFAGKIGFVLQDEPFEALAPLFDQWAGGPGQTFYETEKNEGIAKYADQYPHCSRAYGAWALDFMASAKQSGKPFCMSISFKAPHLPFTPDPIDMKLYKGKSFTRPPNYGVENGTHLSEQVHTSRAATDYREWINDYDDSAAKYYALITGVDAAVGMIREGLKKEGLDKNTVIIFTSDNGYNAGAHGFGDKVIPYEESAKAPLVIYDPRLPTKQNGESCEALTANVDMASTILALAGSQPPADIDGKNLLPLLTKSTDKVRDYLPLFNFWGIDSAQAMAVVAPEWKYIYWYYGKAMTPTEELFHLGNDQYEMTNAAANKDYAKELATMRAHYDDQVAKIAERFVPNHGYDPYATLFDRRLPWAQKEELLPLKKVASKGGGEGSEDKPKRKGKKAGKAS